MFPGVDGSSRRIELLDGNEAPKVSPKVARGRMQGTALKEDLLGTMAIFKPILLKRMLF